MAELEQLQNVRERAKYSYSGLYTLLLRVVEAQPAATSATLILLAQSIEQAEATDAASTATIEEIKRDLIPLTINQKSPFQRGLNVMLLSCVKSVVNMMC